MSGQPAEASSNAESLVDAVNQMKERARAAAVKVARTRVPDKMVDPKPILDEARLCAMESTLAILTANSTQPPFLDMTIQDRVMVALRDYWESVKDTLEEEIR